ncbi:MAG: hypothetical protein AB7O93_12475 [Vicinamibacterales bacterium]
MEIAIDRYLDDGKASLVTLALRSRTADVHSAMTALGPDQQAAVHDALSRALDEIVAVMRPAAAPTPAAGR